MVTNKNLIQKEQIKVSYIKKIIINFAISVIRSWKYHKSSKNTLQPKDFIKINKSLIKKSYDNKGIKLTDKEMRKKLENIRKKVKIGQKPKKLLYASKSFVYGLPTPKQEGIADLIYNAYGNKAEEILKKNYEVFIKKKSKYHKIGNVIPRFISPKVEEMKKKEEEKKANLLDNSLEFLDKKDNKPLYKLKMFQDVGSKVAEGIRNFKTFKPIVSRKNIKIQEFNENDNNKIINKVQKNLFQKENIELIDKDLTINKK